MYENQSVRRWFALGLFSCAGLLVTAFWFQYVKGLEPCPMCMMERIITGLAAASCLLGILAGHTRAGIAASLALLVSSGLGMIQAGRHIWLQQLPKDQIPACQPPLSYLADILPLSELLTLMMSGSGDCAATVWRFMGMSIPGWTLVAFMALFLLGLLTLLIKLGIK
jgi:disulfide bond formation protein DsbB